MDETKELAANVQRMGRATEGGAPGDRVPAPINRGHFAATASAGESSAGAKGAASRQPRAAKLLYAGFNYVPLEIDKARGGLGCLPLLALGALALLVLLTLGEMPG